MSTKAVDAARARVAAADAELAALMPEVRTRLARLYRLMPLGYDRLLFSLDDARTFDRAARVVAVLARRDRERLEHFSQPARRRGPPTPHGSSASATRSTC